MASILQFPRGNHAGAGLFRPKIVRLMPSSRGGNEKKYEGISEDGQNWVLKQSANSVAISEWLGYKLSEVCSIAVPYHKIVELPGGEMAFGSRVEGGLEELSSDALSVVKIPSVRDALSKIYSLDLAISNDDRHPSNILWRKNGLGDRVPMAIDFGKALLTQGLPLPDITARNCNTVDQVNALRRVDAWSPKSAARTLGAARTIKSTAVADWIDQAPNEWINDHDRTRFLNWWGSKSFQMRIDDCMMFCS